MLLRLGLFENTKTLRFVQHPCSISRLMQLCNRRSFSTNKSNSNSPSVRYEKPVKKHPSEIQIKVWRPEIEDFLDRVEVRLRKWKILAPLFDNPPDKPENIRLVYKSAGTTRAQLARGLLLGYAIAAVNCIALVTNQKGFADWCLENPFFAVLLAVVSVSFSVYISYVARTFVVAIHMRDTEKFMRERLLATTKGRPAPQQFIITRLRPYTGKSEFVKFNLDDVHVLEREEIDSWSLRRRILHRIDPAAPTIRIRNRWFKLDHTCFVDGEFHRQLLSTEQRSQPPPPKPWWQE